MTDQVFCYYCRRYHPLNAVRLIGHKGVKRWRCVESLTRSRGSVAERDAFGRAVTAANRASQDHRDGRSLPLPVLELLATRPEHFEGLA